MVFPIIMIQQGKIIKKFYYNGAVSPETAKSPESIGILRNVFFHKLVAMKQLTQVSDDRCYVDVEMFKRRGFFWRLIMK